MSTAQAELRIPDLGEGVEEGVVIALLVAAGEAVVSGQALLEIETDKVTLEIPAPRAGVVSEFCVAVDTVVRPGDVVLRMLDAEPATTAVAVPESSASVVEAVVLASPPSPSSAVAVSSVTTPEAVSAEQVAAGFVPAGPAARREARQLGIDIATVAGSGPRGRINVDDVRRHVRERMHVVTATAAQPASEALPDLALFGDVHREPLSRREQATARNLSRAASIIPHAWVENRVDVTALEAARRARRRAQNDDAAPLTVSAILCHCVASALREFPRFNAAYDALNNALVYRDYVNIGVAVDTERGLLVPVIRNADTLDIEGIAAALDQLARAARDNRLAPADMRGGGCTISNLGALGVSAMQPIVNWPEAAILGVSGLQEVFAPHGEGFATRKLLPLVLGFDHRLINSADAARFLAFIAAMLSDGKLLDQPT